MTDEEKRFTHRYYCQDCGEEWGGYHEYEPYACPYCGKYHVTFRRLK